MCVCVWVVVCGCGGWVGKLVRAYVCVGVWVWE